MTRAIHLIEPDSTWQSAFLDMAAEFAASGDLRYQAALTDFTGYLERRLQFAHGEHLPPNRVRENTYWAVEGTMIVGSSRLRHTLTPTLHQIGGHIAYEIRPAKRGQGYATVLLAHTLHQARQFGIPAVLITCDIDNIGSARVIEKNGGRLVDQTKIDGYAKMISRYWIDLPATNELQH